VLTKLTPERHDLVWGSRDTEPWYPNPEGLRTAEVWYPAGELLIKFLFTTENLSVQVHPNDEQAVRVGKTRGKTEMWHILRAEPGARIALGLNRSVTEDELRTAALDGSIVELLNWIPVSSGETYYTPAGTIHAIGAGIALCEIQQLSDVTYRLYDWGRGRELHLDAGVDVSKRESGGEGPTELPVNSPYFFTQQVMVTGSETFLSAPNTTWIALSGDGLIAGQPFRAGDVFHPFSTSGVFRIEAAEALFLAARQPGD
jgi:mannose-6-phosphate isomerase